MAQSSRLNGRSLIGIVVAAVAAFFWGFVFWGASTLGYSTWSTTANDETAQVTLAALFPESGYYQVPAATGVSPEELTKLLSKGPMARVNIVHNPPLGPDPVIMLSGLAHGLVCFALLAWLISRLTSPPLLTAFAVGLIGTVFSSVGDMIWWNYPLPWKATVMAYDLGFWLIGGLVLAYFMKDRDTLPG